MRESVVAIRERSDRFQVFLHSFEQGNKGLKLLVGKVLKGLVVHVLKIPAALKRGVSASFRDPDLVETGVGSLAAFAALDVSVALQLLEGHRNGGRADVEMLGDVLLRRRALASGEIHKHTVLRAVHTGVTRPLLDNFAVQNVGRDEGMDRFLNRCRVAFGVIYRNVVFLDSQNKISFLFEIYKQKLTR